MDIILWLVNGIFLWYKYCFSILADNIFLAFASFSKLIFSTIFPFVDWDLLLQRVADFLLAWILDCLETLVHSSELNEELDKVLVWCRYGEGMRYNKLSTKGVVVGELASQGEIV